MRARCSCEESLQSEDGDLAELVGDDGAPPRRRVAEALGERVEDLASTTARPRG
jgi:hypothetical protein